MDTTALRLYIQQLASQQLPDDKKPELLQQLEEINQQQLTDLFPDSEWMQVQPMLMSRNRIDMHCNDTWQKLVAELPAASRSPLLLRRGFIIMYARAAVIIFLIVSALWLWHHQSSGVPAVEWKQLVTLPGQQKRVLLADGSVIMMNGGSRMLVPENFESSKRQVQLLQGEAFIEVAPDAQRPFSTVTGDCEVHVLGTSFNIRNNASDTLIKVALRSGRIAVYKNTDIDTLLPEPGMICHLSKHSSYSEVVKGNVNSVGSWQHHELIFADATLSEILQDLENQYGASFEVRNKHFLNQRFNASFRQRSLADIIRQLSVLGHFRYKQKNKLFIIE